MRRTLFPLRRCPGLVAIPEVDDEIVIVVVDRPSTRRSGTAVRAGLAAGPDAATVCDRPVELR